jgi:hypothetical protein
LKLKGGNLKNKELQWGETPFHRMTPGELLKAAIKMYDGLVSAKSALALCEYNDRCVFPGQFNPFWTQGTGGIALEKCRQVVDPMEKKYSSENIYRSFYRPAVDLLWKDNGQIELTTKWAVCPVCGNWVGKALHGQDDRWGKRCGDVGLGDKCNGILRPMTWDDVKIEEVAK